MGGPTASGSRFWVIAIVIAITLAIAVNVAIPLLADDEPKGSRPPIKERPSQQVAR